ncbi:hypothetical protein H4R19_002320 [Coemansia spiralis]|nr:hypothetical protein H4R19_002320 [Coemansia spiralis]
MWRRTAAVLLCALAAVPGWCAVGIKGGVLVKNGRQTSCNLLVMNSKAALVAAACLDFSSDRVVDRSTKYQVYLDDRIDSSAAKYDVVDVTVSGYYAAETLANNIAVLQYNTDGKVTWNVPVASTGGLGHWDEVVFDRCSLTDVGAMKWAAPVQHAAPEIGDFGVCEKLTHGVLGPLYFTQATNLTAAQPPPGQPGCAIPFGAVYGMANGTAFLLATYSHTLVNGGTDLCRYDSQCSYYAYTSVHAGLVASTVGRDAYFGLDILGISSSVPMDDSSMDNYNSAANASIATLSGDLFRSKDADGGSSLDSSSDQSQSTGPDKDGASSDNSRSRRNAVIIAVCTTVGGLVLIGTAVVLVMRHLRRKRLVPDPIAETRVHEILRTDGAVRYHDLPPLYDGPPR